ncbi:MAE_28990/MAE_18760 family HEPN-like nuclease [Mucilaginibacter sp.]|uniref:MAE_28990/MAE_18760 family HEPN-like nuclease n=1 Tax=Mucilaginibacter sp. TaxID=1882438 RepID=UPI00260803B3|nr:MAE_28990/MAE_18760 family HEPN-like nuclease [Mucilaginibacter sp.]MDB5029829.1 hypothetical protein [Mucilaginibacter sp.]
MKVRTLNELESSIDSEISWRKKELVDYKLTVDRNINSTIVIPLCRGGIALSYAHWEGFIKSASSLFINYISMRKIPLNSLKTNFVALAFQRQLNKGKAVQECVTLIDELLFQRDKPAKFFERDIIDTKANLRFGVLSDILLSLGLDKTQFAAKENFLDKKLVEPRNDIAHGTYRDISYEDYLIVHENIIPLMEHYKTLIENSAALESYKI